MKLYSIIFSIFTSLTCSGQNEQLLLKETTTSIEELIPENWKVLDSKTGDLNHDGILDFVFAIQDTDKDNIELNDGLGSDTIDLNPRMLGIYFGNKAGSYRKQLIAEDFIILRDSPTMDEPFEGFNITKKGVLEITFQFWYSAGSWSMSNHKYKFRFQNNAFVLIGYDSNEAHRGTGETTDYSINFLSKKMKTTKGNFSNDVSESVEWKNFALEKPITLKTMVKPFQLELEGISL